MADPKKGKSWFVLYLVILIATGHSIFGRKVKPQTTVYFPLEDNEIRINSRAEDIYQQFNISDAGQNNWSYALTLDRMGEGLKESLLDYLSKNPRITFLVIDVLGKIRPMKESNGIYKADYAIGDNFKCITDKHPNLGMIIVHHSNKGDKIDVVKMVSGSNGLAGSFDNVFGIHGDKLIVNGRDLVQEDEIELVKNNQGQYTMSAPDITNGMSDTRKKVYEFIELNSMNKFVTPKEIEIGTGLSNGSVTQQLKRLSIMGLIRILSRGQYTL